MFGGGISDGAMPVHRKLQGGDAPGVQGDVVMGIDGDPNDYELFVTTNATNFPKGTLNGTLIIAASPSEAEECTTEAYGNALKFPLKERLPYIINALGMIEGGNKYGWHTQSIRELQQGISTLPISLFELMISVEEGLALDYGLTVYVLGAEEELLGCASMKTLDDATKAEYHKVVHGFSQEAVMEVPSSASKNGMFAFVSAIAAVGIAFVLGDVLAL